MVRKNTTKKTAKQVPEIVKLERFTTELPCKLTDDELLKCGEQLGTVHQDIDAEKDRQTSVKAQMKARLTELESRATILSCKLTRKEEERSVEVEPEKDFRKAIYHEKRLDTGKFINERPLRADEYQEELK